MTRQLPKQLQIGRIAATRIAAHGALASCTLVVSILAIYASAAPVSAQAGGPASREAVLLPSIRRLGLAPVKSNLAEYRSFASRESSGGSGGSEAGGFASSPLTSEQASDRLLELLEHAVETSGRYFSVSLAATPGGDASNALSPGEPKAQSAARLERDYDLDAWLTADVVFTPEQARVRLVIKGPQTSKGARASDGVKSQVTFAREDVYVRADAGEKALHEAFLTALGRVSETLGHDGRVTSLRDDLVTLDFGIERGIAVGSRVELGLVVLSASHPASGETLRSRKVTTHIVEILEARSGTSIARIARRNPIVVRQAATLFAKGYEDEIPLLAWRHRAAPALSTGAKAPWETAREVETTPLTGSAEQGFDAFSSSRVRGAGAADGVQGEKADASFLGSIFGRQGDTARGLRRPTQVTSKSRNSDADRDADRDVVGADGEGESDGQGENGGVNAPAGEAQTDTDTGSHEGSDVHQGKAGRYRLLSASGGLGMTFGILGTDRGDRYTDFPATVLNTAVGRVHVELPAGWETEPEIAMRLFSGGDVEGSQFALSAPVLTLLRDDGKSRLLVGGAVEIGGGSVKTIRVKKSLSHFALLGVGEFEARVPGVGEADIGAGLAVFGLLGGRLEGYVRASVRPSSFLPAPLSLYGRLSSGPKKWSAFEFGALWKFHDVGR